MITFQQFRSDKFSWLIFLKDMQYVLCPLGQTSKPLPREHCILIPSMLIDSPVHTLMTFVGKHLHVFVYFYIKFRF